MNDDGLDIQGFMDEVKEQAVLLHRTIPREKAGAPGCWLGGLPTLPDEIAWPYYKNTPMHFIAQLNLASLPALGTYDVPKTGTMFFFHDTIVYPVSENSIEGTRVIYIDDDVSKFPRRPYPKFPKIDKKDAAFWYEGKHGYKYWPIFPVVIDTYPSWLEDVDVEILDLYRDKCDLAFGAQIERLKHLTVPHEASPLNSYSKHQWLGAMPDEEYSRTVLLLTVDCDDGIGLTYGDCETISFTMNLADLKARNFDRVYGF